MRYITLLVLMVCVFLSVGAQNNNKEVIVVFESEYSVRGVVVNKTEESIEIRTKEGELYQYPMEEVVRIKDAKDKTRIKGIGSNTKDSLSPGFSFNLDSALQKEPINVFKSGNQVISLGLYPVALSYERCVVEQLFNDKSALGVGGRFDFKSSEYIYSSTNLYTITADAAIHYQLIDKLDTYLGLSVGVKFHKVVYDNLFLN